MISAQEAINKATRAEFSFLCNSLPGDVPAVTLDGPRSGRLRLAAGAPLAEAEAEGGQQTQKRKGLGRLGGAGGEPADHALAVDRLGAPIAVLVPEPGWPERWRPRKVLIGRG